MDCRHSPIPLLTIFSWWEEVKNRGEDGPKKGGSRRAGGHLNSSRLLLTTIGLLLTPVMIGCLCILELKDSKWFLPPKKSEIKNNNLYFHWFVFYSRPLTEPFLPTVLLGAFVFGGVEVIRLLSASQCRRDFFAGLSCCNWWRPKINK